MYSPSHNTNNTLGHQDYDNENDVSMDMGEAEDQQPQQPDQPQFRARLEVARTPANALVSAPDAMDPSDHGFVRKHVLGSCTCARVVACMRVCM